MNSPLILMPGDYFFGQFEGRIITLLGSCVAVTLWHPQRRIAAVTHYLLPRGQRFDPQDTHYGEAVFAQLLQDMQHLGTQPGEYRKGLFGGGNQLMNTGNSSMQVAANNVRFAREQFQQLGWQVDKEDTGGNIYRRLWLNGLDGRSVCKNMASPSCTNTVRPNSTRDSA